MSTTWFYCILGVGAELYLRPRCYLQGGKVTLEGRHCFPSFPAAGHLGSSTLGTACIWLSIARSLCSVFCLSFHIPLAKEFSQILTILSQFHQWRFFSVGLWMNLGISIIKHSLGEFNTRGLDLWEGNTLLIFVISC